MPRKSTEGRKGKPPAHRPTAIREQDRERIGFLQRMGFSRSRICLDVGITEKQLDDELDYIKTVTLKSIIEDRKFVLKQEYQVLMDVRSIAIENMERAIKEGKTKTMNEEGTGGEGGFPFSKQRTEKEELLAPSAYLSIVIDTNRRICDLFGLDETVRVLFNDDPAGNSFILSADAVLSIVMRNRGVPGALPPHDARMPAIQDKQPSVEELIASRVDEAKRAKEQPTIRINAETVDTSPSESPPATAKKGKKKS